MHFPQYKLEIVFITIKHKTPPLNRVYPNGTTCVINNSCLPMVYKDIEFITLNMKSISFN